MKNERILVLSVLASLTVGTPHALADGAGSKSPVLDTSDQLATVTVTAERRRENLQKAALSIEAFSGNYLRANGVMGPDDLNNIASGVQISGGTTTQIYVRGVGDFGVTATANPAVVTSLDGVVISRPQAISGNFFDLERVELLKGPQGTLYGRNASAGALNIITVPPKLGETSGYVDVNLGDYRLREIEGALNLPTGKRGAFRLAYQLNSRGGYLSDGSDDDHHQSVRLESKFEFDHGLALRTEATYVHLGGIGSGMVVSPTLPGTSPWTGNTSQIVGDAYMAAAAAQFQAALQAGCSSNNSCPLPPTLLANPAGDKLFQDVDTYSFGLQLDKKFGNNTFTIIPSWRHTAARFAVQPSFLYNVGGAYDAAGDRSKGEDSNQYSFEARLAHDTSALKWVIGANWFRERIFTDYALYGGMILNTRTMTDFHTDAIAGFGQLTYSVTDRFRLTGGVRYTRDKRGAFDYKVYGISPTVLAPAAVTGLPPIPCLPDVPASGMNPPGTLCPLVNPTPGFYNSTVTFDKATWKAGFEYDLAPQSMLYANVATGFKAGGFNQAVSLNDPSKLQPFNPERITAYTLGVKNRFLGDRLQVNLEAFYWDYRDMQLSAQAIDGAGNIVLLTQNAGKARIDGADVDLITKPWHGGTVHATLELVDSIYKEFMLQELAMFVPPGRTGCAVSAPNQQGLVAVNCSGKPLMRSPKVSGNVDFTQVFPLANTGNLTFDANVAFAGGRYTTTDFVASQYQKSYTNLSAALTYHAPGDHWYAGIWGRNLSNEAILTGGAGHQAAFVTGWFTSNIEPPRTYGVRFGVRY